MYGQLNELREEIMNKVMTNQDLLKFLFYCDLVEINAIRKSLKLPEYLTIDKADILSLPNLNRTQKDSLKLNQIFKYKRMPLNSQVDAKCFLSMQFGRVLRDNKNNHWSLPLFAFTIVCPDAISETLNGSRILAIEQCLEDSFAYQHVAGIGQTFVIGSEPETVDTGLQSRTMTLRFLEYVK